MPNTSKHNYKGLQYISNDLAGFNFKCGLFESC